MDKFHALQIQKASSMIDEVLQNLPAGSTAYNHMYTLSFSVDSEWGDGHDCLEKQQRYVLAALLQRIANVLSTDTLADSVELVDTDTNE